ncbi:MAG: hypothetical protein RKH07_05730 [Gammaproteobacteria bacterium]
MELPDFIEFAPFNKMREDMGTRELGYFELFDPALHLTGEERSALANGGVLNKLDNVKTLPDNTLAIKNSRVLLYIPDENWFRQRREYPTYHVARCSLLDELYKESPDQEYLVTTRLAQDYDMLKYRDGGEYSLASVGFVVCKHCLHKLRYKDFDEFRNRKRGYSQKVLNEFKLEDFYRLYKQYPLSFGGRQEQ